MSLFDKVLYVSIVIYIIFITIILITKPSFLCDKKTQTFKHFGMNDGETICPIHVLSISMCVMIYLFVMIYMFVMTKLELY